MWIFIVVLKLFLGTTAMFFFKLKISSAPWCPPFNYCIERVAWVVLPCAQHFFITYVCAKGFLNLAYHSMSASYVSLIYSGIICELCWPWSQHRLTQWCWVVFEKLSVQNFKEWDANFFNEAEIWGKNVIISVSLLQQLWKMFWTDGICLCHFFLKLLVQ